VGFQGIGPGLLRKGTLNHKKRLHLGAARVVWAVKINQKNIILGGGTEDITSGKKGAFVLLTTGYGREKKAPFKRGQPVQKKLAKRGYSGKRNQ